MNKLSVAVAALALSCGPLLASTAFGADARPDDVSGTTWRVETINGAPPASQTAPTLTFGEQYRLSGSTGCNPFFGIYGVDGRDVAIRTVSAANGPCEVGAEQQTALLNILKGEPKLSLDDGGKMTIADGGGSLTLVRMP